MANGEISMLVTGDINVQNREDPRGVFALVQEELDRADVRIGNCEMCLSSSEDGIPDKRPIADKPYWKHSDARMVEALVAGGFHMVTTGNNVHWGGSAITRSLETLDANGILHTGSGANVEEARRPAVMTAPDGTKIGILGWTCVYFPRNHAATETEPGVAVVKCRTAYEPHYRVSELPGGQPVVRSWPDPEHLAAAQEDVATLRPQVDVLIAYPHMGVSSQEELAEYQRHLARGLVDAGADLVFGASAHRPQAVEVYKEKAIFYGLGNFAFDWWFMRERRHGLVVDCKIRDGKVMRVSFRPVTRTRTDENQVEILSAASPEGRVVVEAVARLSREDPGYELAIEEAATSVTVWSAD